MDARSKRHPPLPARSARIACWNGARGGQLTLIFDESGTVISQVTPEAP